MKRILLSIAALLFVAPLVMHAQTTGTLEGRITDESGEGIPGATILVQGTSRGAAANADGYYIIAGLPAKVYDIEVKSTGKQGQVARVNISVGVNTTQNFTLEEATGDDGTVITVTAQRTQVVNAQTTGKMTELDSRDLTNSTTDGLGAGIQRTTSVSGNYSIRGGRSGEASIRRDGIEISDPVNGSTGNVGLGVFPDVSAFAVEKVQILASGFEAEYGDVLSGAINTVTRSGRNDKFEGKFGTRLGLPFLYGSSDPITVKKPGEDADTVLPGYKLQTSGNQTTEFGVGGYIPGIKNNVGVNAITFFLTGRYNSRNRSGGYNVYDMSQEYADARRDLAQQVWGYSLEPTNIGTIDRDILVRNFNAKLKYDISSKVNVELGGEIGATSIENQGWSTIYQLEHPIFAREENGVVVYDTNMALLERDIQATDENTIINRLTARVFAFLTDADFIELQGGLVSNTFEVGKKDESKDYGIFSVYDIPEIVDAYDLATYSPRNPDLNTNRNAAIDIYELPRDADSGNYVRNPLTGLFEGGQVAGASRNPYGLIDLNFPVHGNTRELELRESTHLTLKGAYETNFKLGSAAQIEDQVDTKVRAGFEFAQYTLRRHNNSQAWETNPFNDVYGYFSPYIKDTVGLTNLTKFIAEPFTPFKGALWAQSKFTYKSIVFAPGLRFDFFNPNTTGTPLNRQSLKDLAQSIDSIGSASVKFQVSPRLGISYPITTTSNFRVNFAMMFKMPELNLMFDNAYGDAQRQGQIFGNPDIQPQKVVIYDLGYEALIAEDYGIDISAFYRDIYNQSGLTYIPVLPNPFTIYSVQEYGNVRGLEVALSRARSDNFYGRLNYTLQRAVGTASSPGANYGTLGTTDPFTGETRKTSLTEFPLSYDQTHNFNATLGLYWNNDDGPSLGGLHILENTDIQFTALFGTGLPYTRVNTRGQQIGEYNGNRGPSSFNTEARIGRTFWLSDIFGESVGDLSVELYFQIYNVLNTTGATSYYATTGSPDQNGTSLDRQIGEFPAIPYFAEQVDARPETYSSLQFDTYGTRYYNPYADLNLDGVVTQVEKYAGYQRFVATIQSLRNNYDQPRTVFIGARLSF